MIIDDRDWSSHQRPSEDPLRSHSACIEIGEDAAIRENVVSSAMAYIRIGRTGMASDVELICLPCAYSHRHN
ncbi:hypothetical protein [Nocardia nepalensis]|uniref:hypothetical protein n=1 Tax=Nocardia nepalensis TaxID=3375448 RepID=UPI003B679211